MLWNWVMGRSWKNLEEQARRILHCYEWNIKGNSGRGSEDKNYRKSLKLLKDYISPFLL